MTGAPGSRASAALVLVLFAAPGLGQAPPPSHDLDLGIDSGWVENTTVDGPAIVYSEEIHVPGAEWLRLWFDEVSLAGNVEEPDHARLRITSLWDGAVHHLNALTAEQWAWSTAYMNGDTLLVEIIAYPDTGPSRLVIDHATVGEPFGAGDLGPASICGSVDNRQLSDDPRSARHMPIGCSAWLIGDSENCFLTAGHCSTGAGDVMQFNVPLSNTNGSPVNPPPEDQYSVDPASVQQTNGGVGNDWGYFGCFPNSNTQLSAFEAQGDAYAVGNDAPPVQGQTIRITGYGTVSPPVPPTWNQAQKTHSGPYFALFGNTIQYTVDTSGGNSGSAVENESTGLAIGIHTHAGCNSVGGNQGTAIHNPGLQNALASPQGICSDGDDAPADSSIYLATDANGNFGNVAFQSFQSGLGVISDLGEQMQGLAFDPDARRFLAVTDDAIAPQRLLSFAFDGTDIVETGTISGIVSDKLYGLACDPASQTLYGIDQTDGQLYTIDTDTALATPVGLPAGKEIGALTFNPDDGRLYAIDDSPGTKSRLLTIDPDTGQHTTVADFPFAVVDFDALAYNEDDGFLWSIRDNGDLGYRIDPADGSLLVFGKLNSSVGPSYGMAFAPDCIADFNGDGNTDILDFTAFQIAFQDGDDAADVNDDGELDILDFTAFQAAFAKGCE